MTADSRTLLLWGDTQVGKTTLLTTTFGPCADRITAVDRVKSAKAISALYPGLRRLRTQRLTQATSVYHIDVELVLGNGQLVRLRDVQGGITRLVNEDHVIERLKGASVVLFLMEWKARDIENQINAVRGAWEHSMNAQRGLVFTKCETDLDLDDEAWNGRRDWWQIDEGLAPYRDVVGRFGTAIWPTSSFGFDNDTGYPAVVLGEFGQPLPYRIQPFKVHRPFEWAFQQMGAE